VLLVLFDIDGTLLLKASAEHAASMRAALHEIHGIPDPPPAVVAPAGRTDGEIARQILLQSGVSAERIDARAADVRDVSCREFGHRCPPDLRDKVAPGMVELLDGLAGRDDVFLALVTGNYEPVARLKLERAGIGHHFAGEQGAFGSDNEDRAALPPIARRRAAVNGRPHPRAETVVIGDTPADIACARADGVRCLAVTTGPYPAEDLRAADAVAADAAELAGLLANVV
jgi:phosphoglycolate phosphatase-like HAD superfamily hydrolase